MTLLAELKRRKVFKVGAAYVVIAWIVVQVASIALPAFEAPPWVLRVFILVLMLGFPIALVMAWVFDVTPEGVRAETGRRGSTLVFMAAAALTALALVWYFKGQPSNHKEQAVSAPASATAATPIDSTRSIAVLPFANLGGKADDEYFSDGMTEELLNVLARNTRLKVAARTSVFQYKKRGGDVREIGRALGVGHIVEGSVRRDGERVRITAQLIRVADGFHVWSETWDRELESVFALQDEIAQSLAQQLDSTLGGDARVQSRQDVDPAAYDDFLRARALYRERRNTLTALQLFRSAVARDPRFAAAWANLALACEVAAYHATAMQQRAAGDRMACMREAVARATELAPNAAITLHAQANLARSEGRFIDAERLYRESIQRDDTYPDVREDLAEFLTDMGRRRDGLQEGRALVALEPTSPLFWFRLGLIGSLDDDSALVDEATGRIAAIDPTYMYAITTPFRRALCHGRLEEARKAIDRAFAASPDAIASLLMLFRWSQRDPDGDEALSRQFLRSTYLVDGALIAAARGDADLFFDVIANPRDRDKGFDNFRHLACPIAAPMLSDPRTHAFLRAAGFEAYWRATGWPPQCRALGDDDFTCGKPESTR